ncbi:hypothetical protein PG988_002307 [Apiospora saccharicola]
MVTTRRREARQNQSVTQAATQTQPETPVVDDESHAVVDGSSVGGEGGPVVGDGGMVTSADMTNHPLDWSLDQDLEDHDDIMEDVDSGAEVDSDGDCGSTAEKRSVQRFREAAYNLHRQNTPATLSRVQQPSYPDPPDNNTSAWEQSLAGPSTGLQRPIKSGTNANQTLNSLPLSGNLPSPIPQATVTGLTSNTSQPLFPLGHSPSFQSSQAGNPDQEEDEDNTTTPSTEMHHHNNAYPNRGRGRGGRGGRGGGRGGGGGGRLSTANSAESPHNLRQTGMPNAGHALPPRPPPANNAAQNLVPSPKWDLYHDFGRIGEVNPRSQFQLRPETVNDAP